MLHKKWCKILSVNETQWQIINDWGLVLLTYNDTFCFSGYKVTHKPKKFGWYSEFDDNANDIEP